MPPAPRDRPLISANFALTWDARITTRCRTPADFTSPADKRRLLEIRAQADAILVTVKTAAADCMTMGLPAENLRAARESRGQPPYPLRVLVTNSGRVDATLPVFQQGTAPIVIFSTEQMPGTVRKRLAGKAELRLHANKAVDLAGMMRTLRKEHLVRRLHCEGGGELLHALASAGLLDELYLTLSARIFGGEKAPTLTGAPGAFLPQSTRFRLLRMEPLGQECFLKYRVESRSPKRG